MVLDVRRGRDERQVVLPLQALAHDLHVEQAEEAAPEAEAQRARRLGLVGERRVVQAKPLQRFAQLRVLVTHDGVQPAEDHRERIAVARERSPRVRGRRDRLADASLADLLVPGDQVAHLAGAERRHGRGVRGPHPDLLGVVDRVRLEVLQTRTAHERPVEDAYRADDAAVRVVVRVEDQRTQRRVGVAVRLRDARHDRVEELGHTLAGLRGDSENLVARDPEDALDLRRTALGLRRGQVDLVERGDDREIRLQRGEAVRERLRFDPLARVDQQHGALAGSQAPRHLVPEVDVARRVDQVEDVVLPGEPDVLSLDRDAPLPLEIHRVEVLRPHVPGIDRPTELENPVRERGLAVVDVGDDRERAESFEIGSHRTRSLAEDPGTTCTSARG